MCSIESNDSKPPSKEVDNIAELASDMSLKLMFDKKTLTNFVSRNTLDLPT
jgi:hypothetical protein